MNQKEFEEKIYTMRKRCGENGVRREYWAKEDNEKLREMFDQCYGITEMTVMLNRTERAVYQQVVALGLYEPVYQSRKKSAEYINAKHASWPPTVPIRVFAHKAAVPIIWRCCD